VLIPSLYATSLRTRSLRPVRVPSDQNTRWRLPFYFSTDKRQEFLVSLYFRYTHTIERGRTIAATPHTCDIMLFKKKKRAKQCRFERHCSSFFFPWTCSRGRMKTFVFFLFNSSCLSLPACFCLKPKAPRTPPHDEKSARTCSVNPRPLAA